MRCFLLACAASFALSLGASAERPARPSAASARFPGWPAEIDGRPLREEPAPETEKRFAERFPGRVARFTDGRDHYIIRWVDEPTQEMHVPARCFRGLGYDVGEPAVWIDERGRRWSRFSARRGTDSFLVHERIQDERGGEWTDGSSWLWSATFGTSRGPWWSIVRVERVDPQAGP